MGDDLVVAEKNVAFYGRRMQRPSYGHVYELEAYVATCTDEVCEPSSMSPPVIFFRVSLCIRGAVNIKQLSVAC